MSSQPNIKYMRANEQKARKALEKNGYELRSSKVAEGATIKDKNQKLFILNRFKNGYLVLIRENETRKLFFDSTSEAASSLGKKSWQARKGKQDMAALARKRWNK